MIDGESDDGEPDDDAPGSVSFDPFADLLLGLIAILVPVIALLLASGRTSESVRTAPAEEPPAMHVVATGEGLRVAGIASPGGFAGAPLEVALADILDDAALARRLRETRDRGWPLSFDIAPDGLEAAFLFEGVAARNGPPILRQRRLGAAP